MQEDSRLSDLCLLQFLCSTLEHNLCDFETENLISLVEQLLCLWVILIKVLAHSCELGALTRENECLHNYYFFLKKFFGD